MKWEGREESGNVEDRRSLSPTTLAAGGGGIIVLILALLFGIDPQQLNRLFQGNPPAGQQAPPQQVNPEEERMARFAKVIFHDTEEIWDELFKKHNLKYRKPVLVLFSGQVDSACGNADSAVGPFYCPGDDRVYIDLSFFKELDRRFRAPGEFARAYVIAHEVGHHIQNQLGYSRRADEARRQGRAEGNRASVRLELQADYLAGVWAHHAEKRFEFLEAGDVESALRAASQIGDDTLQRRARGYVVPDAFTHGTSAQRVRWFRRGLQSGEFRKSALDAFFSMNYEDL